MHNGSNYKRYIFYSISKLYFHWLLFLVTVLGYWVIRVTDIFYLKTTFYVLFINIFS